MKRATILIILLLVTVVLCRGDETTLEELVYPKNIHVDRGQIFITDYPHIYIYNLKTRELEKKFGNDGEGPGEFYIDQEDIGSKEKGLEMQLTDKHCIVNSFGRITWFKRSGAYEKMVRFKARGLAFRLVEMGDRLVGHLMKRKPKFHMTLNMYDKDVSFKKELGQFEYFITSFRSKGKFFTRNGLIYQVYKDLLYVTNSGMKELNISVYNLNGDKIKSIRYKTEKLPLTKKMEENYKAEFKDRYKRGLKTILKLVRFPEFFPAVRTFRVSDDRLYVLTFKRDGDRWQFLEFDLNGKFLREFMAPLQSESLKHLYPFTISNGILYQVVSNRDEESWELHTHRF